MSRYHLINTQPDFNKLSVRVSTQQPKPNYSRKDKKEGKDKKTKGHSKTRILKSVRPILFDATISFPSNLIPRPTTNPSMGNRLAKYAGVCPNATEASPSRLTRFFPQPAPHQNTKDKNSWEQDRPSIASKTSFRFGLTSHCIAVEGLWAHRT
ncbi:hypothetical protein AVEN_72245-1 [Araneus ventricosus]|uniref:Uncharacterized protein n=1 Tax=Araneus ventricosus TaxID=182803 RepID=A0A4Y2GU90_ARAVE|nr:hypothetical protein AVEN_72245-1 [Araneus ventricosus]